MPTETGQEKTMDQNSVTAYTKMINSLGFPIAMVFVLLTLFCGGIAWAAVNLVQPWVDAQIDYTKEATVAVKSVAQAQNKINLAVAAQTELIEKVEEAAAEIVSDERETKSFMEGVNSAHNGFAESHVKQETLLEQIKNGMP